MLKKLRTLPLASITMVPLGVVCLIGAALLGWTSFQLRTFGVEATGEFVGTRSTQVGSSPGRFSNPGTSSSSYDVVAFETEDGEQIEFNTTVPDAEESEPLEILYDPDSPETACLKPCDAGGGGMVAIAGIILVWLGLTLDGNRDS